MRPSTRTCASGMGDGRFDGVDVACDAPGQSIQFDAGGIGDRLAEGRTVIAADERGSAANLRASSPATRNSGACSNR